MLKIEKVSFFRFFLNSKTEWFNFCLVRFYVWRSSGTLPEGSSRLVTVKGLTEFQPKIVVTIQSRDVTSWMNPSKVRSRTVCTWTWMNKCGRSTRLSADGIVFVLDKGRYCRRRILVWCLLNFTFDKMMTSWRVVLFLGFFPSLMFLEHLQSRQYFVLSDWNSTEF